jgi:asparagine synthase (glutamine-hydrolysing)
MCGIAGIIGENIASALHSMLISLKHRGPDGSGVFVDGKLAYGSLSDLNVPEGSFGLGHNLLSIVGCESSQPLVHNNFALVCNGEIYNYRELRENLKDDFVTDSDCEVIIKLVQKFYNKSLVDAVVKAVEYLDGDYAFAIYDGENFAAIRDPVGVKPLYYGENTAKNMFAFASERKALWNVGIENVETLIPDSILYNKKILKLEDRLKIQKSTIKKNESRIHEEIQKSTYEPYPSKYTVKEVSNKICKKKDCRAFQSGNNIFRRRG